MTEVLTRVYSGQTPEAPIQPEIVEGVIELSQFDPEIGNLEGAFIGFRSEALVQALVFNFSAFPAIAGLSSQLVVGFGPGRGSPDFEVVIAESVGISPGAFMAGFGTGVPFVSMTGVAGPVVFDDPSSTIGTGTFLIETAFAGLNTPTVDGVPTLASTPVNIAIGQAFLTYEYTAIRFTNGIDDEVGTDADNFVDLRNGDDTYRGGAGDDTIIGNRGDDWLIGGGGTDTASYSTATSGVTVLLEQGGRDVGGDQGADRFKSIENLTGSDHNDRLVGDAEDNRLWGYAGGDVLKGGLGNDTLVGHEGNDELDLGEGDDTADGGPGSDRIDGGDGNDMIEGGDGKDIVN
ncbi:MAG: hypothetical protein AAFY03_10175, partial [Pseudomonadota bacterium]